MPRREVSNYHSAKRRELVSSLTSSLSTVKLRTLRRPNASLLEQSVNLLGLLRKCV